MDVHAELPTKRNSRWSRPFVGRVQITPRDLDYLQVLCENGPTRANALHQIVSPAVKQVQTKKRLLKLYGSPNAYVDRPEQQKENYNANYTCLIYDINKKGEELLITHGRISDEQRFWRVNRLRGTYRNFWHEVMIADIMASIRLGIQADPMLRYISWHQILTRAPEATRRFDNPFKLPYSISHNGQSLMSTLVPDAIFGIEFRRQPKSYYAFFALEADRNTMPVSRSNLKDNSYLRKILAYRSLVSAGTYRTHLGLPNLRVLTVTTNAVHQANIKKLVGDIAGKSELFLFKTLPSLGRAFNAPEPTPHIIAGAWERAGMDPIAINQP